MSKSYDFDRVIDRGGTGSTKWSKYPADVLPMWLADMDFAAAPEIIGALTERLSHPVLGYAVAQDGLRQQIVTDLEQKYRWRIRPEDIVFMPGVEPGFNMALKALLTPGARLAIQMPAYHPILAAPETWGLQRLDLTVSLMEETDLSPLQEADALLLCNPHNPTGKVYGVDELQRIAGATAGKPIISDEIHCDVLFDGRVHTPIATLGEEIAQRTITLMSASKTYNIAGLKTAFAIVENEALRQRFNGSRLGMVDSVNLMGLEATLAAYSRAGAWKTEMLAYLEASRDYLVDAVARQFPGIRMDRPQATFLAWLDCSALGLDDPQRFFLERAKVGLSAGNEFGQAYQQFVRLNFGCPRATLEEGLTRMETALASR